MTNKTFKHPSLLGRMGGALLMLVASIASCKSSKDVQIVTAVKHDTLYQSLVKYDSIYLDNTIYVDRSGDTIYIRENHMQNRYKLIHDTIYYHHEDTIPVVRSVRVQGNPYIPPWCKWLSAIGALGIIAMVVTLYKKVATFL